MKHSTLIQGLIFILVVSLAIAGVYAAEADVIVHNDTHDNADGLYVSGSGDVAHVDGHSRDVYNQAYGNDLNIEFK